MEEFDELVGHRYVPGYERQHCDFVCDVLGWTTEYWIAISIVAGGFLVIGLIFGIYRMIQALREERSIPRPRTDAEKRDHLRAMREMRQNRNH